MTKRLFFLFLILSVPLKATVLPNYECQTKDGVKYEILLKPALRQLVETRSRKTKVYPLVDAQTHPDIRWTGRPLWFTSDATNESLKSLVSIRTERFEKETSVVLEILLNGEDQLDLKCKTNQFHTRVISFQSSDPISKRFNSRLNQISQLRDSTGVIIPIAALVFSQTITQIQKTLPLQNEKEKKKLFSQLYETIHLMDPRSLKKIEQVVAKPDLPFWNHLIQESEYSVYPETRRQIAWIRDSVLSSTATNTDPLQVHFPALRSGLKGFLNSAAFEDKTLSEVFFSEVVPLFQLLPNRKFELFSEGFNQKEKLQLTQIWARLFGRSLEINFAEVQRMAELLLQGIRQTTEWGEIEYGFIEQALREFMSSSQFQFPEARTFFQKQTQKDVSTLSKVQWRDLEKWLSQEQLQFLSSY